MASRRVALPLQTVVAGSAAVTGGGTSASFHRPLTARRTMGPATIAGGGTLAWRPASAACGGMCCRWPTNFCHANGADSHDDCLRFALSVIVRLFGPV
jgi:hypothetical protein